MLPNCIKYASISDFEEALVMENSKDNDAYTKHEIANRFETALRGAFKTPLPAKNVTPKKEKGKPAKASPSSRASPASAKTGRP